MSNSTSLKIFKPTTPGVRHKVKRINVTEGDQTTPKFLTRGGLHTGGRNNNGRITCFHRGGGRKTIHRILNDLPMSHTAKVIGIQWDPNRSAPIALMQTITSDQHDSTHSSSEPSILYYTIAGEGLHVNHIVASSNPEKAADMLPNNIHMIGDRSVGLTVFNFATTPGGRHKIATTPGTYAEVIRHDRRTNMTMLRLPSTELRWVFSNTMGTIGQVGAKDHNLEMTGNAGANRRRGIRPTVRGCAMNPIDHPHGGRTKGGLHDVTPWSKVAKGQPTRSKGKSLGFIVKTARQLRLAAAK